MSCLRQGGRQEIGHRIDILLINQEGINQVAKTTRSVIGLGDHDHLFAQRTQSRCHVDEIAIASESDQSSRIAPI